MLDFSLSATVSDQVWNSTSAQVVLPQSEEEFFAEKGAASMAENTRRRYRRVFARGRGVAYRGKDQYGVYIIDVSPMGIGFYSPIQFLPKEKLGLFFEETATIRITVRRCVRVGPNRYSCGGDFADGPMAPGAYHNFLAELSV